jgi:hypothetical protein
MNADQTDQTVQFMEAFAIGKHFQSEQSQECQTKIDQDA